ncbi:hypothetical protein CPLU01_14775 [Colletotrichum plurivorum]|uniref:Uncharacterized protein n=1 Tax=Colletotrichum plurivorum TaxID=2175906 RepID=A0A8H6MYJ6_9PEZI|nr:hypothetical protein CPLU01_14775 [Colletotrichum plurivorum]
MEVVRTQDALARRAEASTQQGGSNAARQTRKGKKKERNKFGSARDRPQNGEKLQIPGTEQIHLGGAGGMAILSAIKPLAGPMGHERGNSEQSAAEIAHPPRSHAFVP